MVQSIHDLLASRATTIADIAAHFDALDAAERERQATDLCAAEQRRLWDLAADAPAIGLEHFVPPEQGLLTPVHHPGRNTIPGPRFVQHFEKRFCKPRGGTRLFGYNVAKAWFVRPGYFVAYPTAAHESRRARGGVVIDYCLIPDDEVPQGWPPIVPNAAGLQRFVYHRTRDFMRRVSRHVSIGRASKHDERGDREMDYWFTLCRRETAP